MNLRKNFQKLYISCSTHNFYISRMPISYSRIVKSHIKNFIGLQRSIGQQKLVQLQNFKKIIKKTTGS